MNPAVQCRVNILKMEELVPRSLKTLWIIIKKGDLNCFSKQRLLNYPQVYVFLFSINFLFAALNDQCLLIALFGLSFPSWNLHQNNLRVRLQRAAALSFVLHGLGVIYRENKWLHSQSSSQCVRNILQQLVFHQIKHMLCF